MILFISVIAFIASPALAGIVKRQAGWNDFGFGNWGSGGSNSNLDTGNSWQGGQPSINFGPNWGNNQPWGNPTPPPTRPQRQNKPTRPQRQEKPTTAFTDPDTTTPTIIPFLVLFNAPEGCACVKTGQFNPVCGTDSNTYVNMSLLKCYQECGTDVQLRYLGSCRRSVNG